MNQSVNKALELLTFFTKDQAAFTLHELSHLSGMSKPTVYRMLSTLEANGFLEKIKENQNDARYKLGLKFLEYGQLVSDRLELREIAFPYMQELAEQLNEAVHLVIINGTDAIYIEKVDSGRSLRLNARIGSRFPLYMGSGPKLLLAYQDSAFIEKILAGELLPYSDGKVLEKDAFLQQLATIRENAYSWSSGEQDLHATGVAFPIRNHHGKVIASLAISGLASYYEGENLERIMEASRTTSEEISRRLGFITEGERR